MATRTKIICTIGPSCNTLEKIIDLCRAGMNVARLNFSHGTYAEHLSVIQSLKEARQQLGIPLAIMLDTKGPEIRVGKIKDGFIDLHPGQLLSLLPEEIEGDINGISIHPSFILEHLRIGMRVLFDDGYILSKIVKSDQNGVIVEIINLGHLKSGKGVNIPDAELPLPAVTEKDINDIRFGCLHDIDIIAASFVRSAEHVLTIKNLLVEEKKDNILVLAKIENKEGVRNFDSIVQAADGIMIARGDLGVEMPLSEVPRLQKMMISKSYLAGKPSVTATQMLESMIHHPRPTRAEVSDVANAIYDSTSAVMLSGETAIGRHPLEAVNVMRSIIEQTEADFSYIEFFEKHTRFIYHDVPSAVTLATVKTAYNSNAKAIFAFTHGGSTARLLSRLRPEMPIIAMTPEEKCYHQMSLNWGVIPFLQDNCKTIVEAFSKVSEFALDKGHASYGDLVVVTAGSPFGISGTTNMMIVESIGDVLVRGQTGYGRLVYGNVSIVMTAESKPSYATRGQILVITKCDDAYIPLIRESLGVILENLVEDLFSEQYLIEAAKALNKPVLVRADGACRILKEGQLVTLDPQKSRVYKGVILS
ncbi:MAG: pyruvate kinase [Parachlamydiaceae bacterium]|nr:pyruvate kinase [Parachlamydiaceae bacterium]